MSPSNAAQLLDLPADATSDLIEARFLELRAKLEEKIGKAPTPGLKEKYRATLAEISTAFETLTLNADSSSLPVTQKKQPSSPPAVSSATGPAKAGGPPAAKRRQSGGKEFLLVAICSVILLAGGGWWVLSTRAENERQVRIAAAQQAETGQLAELARQMEADKARKRAELDRLERERGDRQTTLLRTRLSELNLAFDHALRAERTAERELSDLQSDLSADRTNTSLANRVKAQTLYVRWIRDYLADHPARAAKALAESAVSARGEDATPRLDSYAAAIATIKGELEESRPDPQTIATLEEERKLANAGNVVSMNWISYVYFDAAGVPRDEVLGVDWARKAAAKGNLQSMTRLGDALSQGRGVPQDEKAAFEWYRKAAELGHDYGLFAVGFSYMQGSGVDQNSDLAIEWFMRAAAKGDVAAMSNLGLLDLQKGDTESGLRWLKGAAAKGNVYSLHLLSALYLGQTNFTGVAILVDEPAALDYLQQAARLGSDEAQQDLKKRGLTW